MALGGILVVYHTFANCSPLRFTCQGAPEDPLDNPRPNQAISLKTYKGSQGKLVSPLRGSFFLCYSSGLTPAAKTNDAALRLMWLITAPGADAPV